MTLFRYNVLYLTVTKGTRNMNECTIDNPRCRGYSMQSICELDFVFAIQTKQQCLVDSYTVLYCTVM